MQMRDVGPCLQARNYNHGAHWSQTEHTLHSAASVWKEDIDMCTECMQPDNAYSWKSEAIWGLTPLGTAEQLWDNFLHGVNMCVVTKKSQPHLRLNTLVQKEFHCIPLKCQGQDEKHLASTMPHRQRRSHSSQQHHMGLL